MGYRSIVDVGREIEAAGNELLSFVEILFPIVMALVIIRLYFYLKNPKPRTKRAAPRCCCPCCRNQESSGAGGALVAGYLIGSMSDGGGDGGFGL